MGTEPAPGPPVTAYNHIEAYKSCLAARPVAKGRTMAPRTIRHRLGILRVFFERVIEWGWPDAPRACPIFDSTCHESTTLSRDS
jgi:hypothetical protein